MAGPSGAASSSSSWKTPTIEQQKKFNLITLPDDFQPTKQEEGLLAMYETFRTYERHAARLKEEAARAKLAARHAEFKKAKKASSRKRKKAKLSSEVAAAVGDSDEDALSDDDDDDDDSNDDNDDDDDDDLDSEILAERREKKLAAKRKEEEAKQMAEYEENLLREQHLATADDDDDGPSLMRKNVDTMDDQPSSSLIANISNTGTPIHDFSKKLELKPWQGKTLFPTSAEESKWTPVDPSTNSLNDPFTTELDDFDVTQAQHGSGNNTLAIKCTVPYESRRFSINIAGQDHGDFHDILFHFNPRRREKGGQVIVNDRRDALWGHALSFPLSQLPHMFGRPASTLIIQITGEGFDVFVDQRHCARFEHRTELSMNKSLVLQFPSTDDYGKPEDWIVHKVWWGNKPIMAKSENSSVPGMSTFNSFNPRKLFIRALDRLSDDTDLDLRKAELERAFRKYGGDLGVKVLAPKNKAFAFVEMESEAQADLALKEMADTYRMTKARRSRQEALLESKAAAAQAKKKRAPSEWD